MSARARPSIRRRTILLFLGVSWLGILVAGLGFFALQYRSYRQTAGQDLRSLGEVLAYNAAPAVVFEDPELAAKGLAGLHQRPDILRAEVLRADGSSLGVYQTAGGNAEGRLRVTSCAVLGGGGHRVGTVVLVSDQRVLSRQLRSLALTLLGAMLVPGLGILLLSLRLQHFLTGPILDLAGVAEAVSARKDYGLRAGSQGTRELDALAEAFNGMLGKIQEQDRELADHLGHLARELQERKLTEAALRTSEQRFRALVDNTSDMMFWIGLDEAGDFVVEDVNPAQERLLGLPRSAIAGRRIQDILPPGAAPPVIAHYRQCLAAGHPLAYEERVQLDGRVMVAQTLLLPLAAEDGALNRIVGTSRDISQQRAAEESFRQAQKLESLGILAGGIAHDFNNLLTAILGNLNLAGAALPEGSRAGRYLEKVEKTVLRASELTRQMLAYSGRGHFEVGPLDLNLAVTEIAHLLSVSIPKTARLDFRLEKGLPAVEADGAQLQQVVMNLVTNAAEAIGDREGVIELLTRSVVFSEATTLSGYPDQVVPPGRYVVLETRDTGIGMDEETLRRIFDPFFTTKPGGRGLGLSAMLGIIKGHKGAIRIESTPGVGTVFQVFLPCCGTGAGAAAPGQDPAAGRLKGRILLVEDEDEIREASATDLARHGLTVVEARDGQEALDRFRETPRGFDLVVMDLTMPRMDGRTAFQEIRKLNPDTPVILCSGYDQESFAASFGGEAPTAFVQKPYRPQELRRRVASVIAG